VQFTQNPYLRVNREAVFLMYKAVGKPFVNLNRRPEWKREASKATVQNENLDGVPSQAGLSFPLVPRPGYQWIRGNDKFLVFFMLYFSCF
jgi:hypothetical protein